MKKLVSMLLAVCLLCTSFIGCSSSSSESSTDDSSSSSSTDSSSESSEEEIVQTRPLDIVVGVPDTIGDAEDLYAWKYLDYITDIEFEITHVLDIDSSISTYKQLAFAAGTMPDVMIRMDFDSTDVMTYGVGESQVVSFTEYIDAGLMPNLEAALEDYPEALITLTAPDGGIYSLGGIQGLQYEDGVLTGSTVDYSIRLSWLEEADLEVPETLDEFIEMLRTFKTMYPDSIPLGGSYEYSSCISVVASSLGIVFASSYNSEAFTEPALVDDTTTFIWGDQELYEPFLETFITMYEEGLISQDYFTLDSTTVQAQAASGLFGATAGQPIVVLNSADFEDFYAATPLTSDYNDEKVWTLTQNTYTIGYAVITSNCENPELAAQLIDFYYDPEIVYRLYNGPLSTDDEEIKFGLSGIYIDDSGTYTALVDEVDGTGEYSTFNTYRSELISATASMLGYFPNSKEILANLLGEDYVAPTWDITTAAGVRRQGNWDNFVEYQIIGYPENVYFDSDTVTTITDLESVLVDYAEMQFAQFVTGQRSIDELDDYFAELDAMGYQEYLSIYYDYYESTK